jgi:hypothetical protein
MSEPFAGPRRSWAWERWLPLAGVAAVVLWVTGFIVGGESPDPFEASAREWVTYVGDHDGQILASRLLTLLGVMLFISFLGTLRTALRAAEGEPGPWAAMAFGSGIALAVLLFAATTPLLAAAATSGAVEAGAAQALAVSEIGLFYAAEVAAASPPDRDRPAGASDGRLARLARLGEFRHRLAPARRRHADRLHRVPARIRALGDRRERRPVAEEARGGAGGGIDNKRGSSARGICAG